MIDIKLNRNEILEKAKKQTQHFENIDYTYDRIFDILRVSLISPSNFNGKEFGNLYLIKKDNKPAYIEISNFIDSPKYDFFKNYLGTNVSEKIKKIYNLIY